MLLKDESKKVVGAHPEARNAEFQTPFSEMVAVPETRAALAVCGARVAAANIIANPASLVLRIALISKFI
ncbi:hypothetical protein A1355_16110 [Methylomonas koyamae]|uniref:Uncharacterized protein n=1 Tax=Methylomonas koyamae TaxID=702114 RepID=A0A177N2L3_9GAMM|nr:hypothetical protein A1355_16110 [Methylomonas koyamae]